MLLGLAGTAGVGKTTIARHFEDRKGFHIMSYAQPLKAALTALTGLPMEFFTEIELKEQPLEFGKSPREMMQLMGTEFVREMVSEDFWVWRMRQRIEGRPGSDIIIDDIRFENEAQLVRDMGGAVIHLDRQFESPTVHSSHQSEQALEVMPEALHVGVGFNNSLHTFKFIWRIIHENSKF